MTAVDPVLADQAEAAYPRVDRTKVMENMRQRDRREGFIAGALSERATQEDALATENLEIINGWLVERGALPLDYPAGLAHGAMPYSDAEPILHLSELPGWPAAEAIRQATDKALSAAKDAVAAEFEWTSVPDLGRLTYAINNARAALTVAVPAAEAPTPDPATEYFTRLRRMVDPKDKRFLAIIDQAERDVASPVPTEGSER